MFNRFFSIALAAAALTQVANCQYWATFWTDTNCTYRQSIAFSTSNPGCIAAHPEWRSVRFHGQRWSKEALIYSPDTKCSCQHNCVDYFAIEQWDKEQMPPIKATKVGGETTCYRLDGKNSSKPRDEIPPAMSYRFIKSSAPVLCKTNECLITGEKVFPTQ